MVGQEHDALVAITQLPITHARVHLVTNGGSLISFVHDVSRSFADPALRKSRMICPTHSPPTPCAPGPTMWRRLGSERSGSSAQTGCVTGSSVPERSSTGASE